MNINRIASFLRSIDSLSSNYDVYLCSHEMVNATTNFAIAVGRLEDKKEEIEESEDRNDGQSEPE